MGRTWQVNVWSIPIKLGNSAGLELAWRTRPSGSQLHSSHRPNSWVIIENTLCSETHAEEACFPTPSERRERNDSWNFRQLQRTWIITSMRRAGLLLVKWSANIRCNDHSGKRSRKNEIKIDQHVPWSIAADTQRILNQWKEMQGYLI